MFNILVSYLGLVLGDIFYYFSDKIYDTISSKLMQTHSQQLFRLSNPHPHSLIPFTLKSDFIQLAEAWIINGSLCPELLLLQLAGAHIDQHEERHEQEH